MEDQKKIRVYADGVYDLFHYGHAKQLEQAKKSFPNVHLIVGVCSQEDVERFKGDSVMNGEQRAEGVKHCKWVDEVVYPSPWILDEQFLIDHKIDYVAHDDIPYATGDVDDAYALCKKLGKFKATQRTEGISTSDIIGKILLQREDFLLRNLNRGYKRKQLGVGIFEYWQLKLKSAFKKAFCLKKKKKND